MQKLLESITNIRVGKIARSALWLVAEFADSPERAEAALEVLSSVIPTPSEEDTKKVNITEVYPVAKNPVKH